MKVVAKRNFLFTMLRSEINKLLMLSAMFTFSMLAFRIAYTGQLHFLFLVWNLFLAFVPYFISSALQEVPRAGKKLVLFLGLLSWLCFIPNSFYILTDLFHLYDSFQVPRWFDLALIFSFAWNALLMGVLSVRQIEQIFERRGLLKSPLAFLFPVMFLNALGVYIGRYMRFNSWDVITNPFGLAGDIVEVMIHPLRYANAWGMIICFSFLLCILYSTIKLASRALSGRLPH